MHSGIVHNTLSPNGLHPPSFDDKPDFAVSEYFWMITLNLEQSIVFR